MGMGHILYCLYIFMIIFFYVFKFLSVVSHFLMIASPVVVLVG